MRAEASVHIHRGEMDEQVARKTKGIAAVERALRVLDAFLVEESP